ncbi:hypothetical protein [Nostoc sp.]
MHSERLRLKTCGRAAIEEHFQQEAGNEVLKGFWLKLTLVSFFCALTAWSIYLKIAVNVICAISDRKQCSSSLEHPSSQGKPRRAIRLQAMSTRGYANVFLIIKAMSPTGYAYAFDSP